MPSIYDNLPYRPCVGICLFNKSAQVFIGERLDQPGAWQLPQGGIDRGETWEDATFREMKEEVGTNEAKILGRLEEPLRYDLPDHLLGKLWSGKYRGQEQIWVAALFTGEDMDIDITAHTFPEFRAWKWAPLQSIVDIMVPFKRPTYEKIANAFQHYAEDILRSRPE